MAVSTILLIAVAAVLVFIMYRVGRGARDAAHAHAAVSPPNPDGQARPEPHGHAGHRPESDGARRKRHGCC